MSQSVSLGSSANTWRKAASGGYFGGKRSRVIYHWKHQGCHTCLCALMELYGTWGGFSVKWDIKLSCLLGRLCAVAVPYASCVIFQLLPLFVATAVVLLSCYIKFSRVAVVFFFLLDFSTFPLCEGTIWHSYYIRTCRQFPLRQLHRSRAARQRRKWRREEGEKVGEITSKNKISQYSGFGSWDRQLPPTPMSPVVVRRSLLSLRGTRCWYGGLALCSPPRSARQEDWTCRALSAMALLKGMAVGSLLWL